MTLLVLITALFATGLVYTGYVVFEEPTRTISISLEELMAGKQVFMREGDMAVFTSSLWEYNLSLKKSDGASADFIFSAPYGKETFSIREGESHFFDLDGDEINDFNVSFVRSEPTELEFWMYLNVPEKEEGNKNTVTNETFTGQDNHTEKNKTVIGLPGTQIDAVSSDLSTFQRLVRNRVQLLFISLCLALVLGIIAALYWSYYSKNKSLQEDIAFQVTPGSRRAYDFG